jgi:Hint module
MTDLKIGDRVAVIRTDGSRGFEDVYLFTHKDGVTSAPYVTLTLESGRKLSLSPRHFIPVATVPGADWRDHVLKGGNEVRTGDVVWFEGADGAATASPVVAIAEEVRTGLFNPLTLGGTILVDGVAASAHSDWFLDGLVSADTQGKVYQAIFLPVRAIYHLIGPARMETIAEHWGVVDVVREATTQRALRSAMGWGLAGLAGLSLALGGFLWWWRRAAVH